MGNLAGRSGRQGPGGGPGYPRGLRPGCLAARRTSVVRPDLLRSGPSVVHLRPDLADALPDCQSTPPTHGHCEAISPYSWSLRDGGLPPAEQSPILTVIARRRSSAAEAISPLRRLLRPLSLSTPLRAPPGGRAPRAGARNDMHRGRLRRPPFSRSHPVPRRQPHEDDSPAQTGRGSGHGSGSRATAPRLPGKHKDQAGLHHGQ